MLQVHPAITTTLDITASGSQQQSCELQHPQRRRSDSADDGGPLDEDDNHAVYPPYGSLSDEVQDGDYFIPAKIPDAAPGRRSGDRRAVLKNTRLPQRGSANSAHSWSSSSRLSSITLDSAFDESTFSSTRSCGCSSSSCSQRRGFSGRNLGARTPLSPTLEQDFESSKTGELLVAMAEGQEDNTTSSHERLLPTSSERFKPEDSAVLCCCACEESSSSLPARKPERQSSDRRSSHPGLDEFGLPPPVRPLRQPVRKLSGNPVLPSQQGRPPLMQRAKQPARAQSEPVQPRPSLSRADAPTRNLSQCPDPPIPSRPSLVRDAAGTAFRRTSRPGDNETSGGRLDIVPPSMPKRMASDNNVNDAP